LPPVGPPDGVRVAIVVVGHATHDVIGVEQRLLDQMTHMSILGGIEEPVSVSANAHQSGCP
jgi:hypothetical protein